MNYVFTDQDKRTYKRQSEETISIEVEYLSLERVNIALKEGGKNILELTLSKKESAGIIRALNTANSECKCIITIL
jgi:hypothetical protein